MDTKDEQPRLWSNAQTYGMAIVCMVIGLVSGYLLHPPKQAVANQQPQPSQTAMSGAAPTPDQMKHMADKAAEPLLASLKKDPNNADLLAQLGSLYFRTQQFAEAVDYYGRSTQAKPNAEVLVSLANAYHYAGTDDKAIDSLNRALEVDPKSANALFNLGILKWQVNNDPKGAIDAWQRLLKANPKHPRRAQVESMIAKAKKHMNMPATTKSETPGM